MRRLALLLAGAAAAGGCAGGPDERPGVREPVVVVAGDDALAGVLRAVEADYERANPGADLRLGDRDRDRDDDGDGPADARVGPVADLLALAAAGRTAGDPELVARTGPGATDVGAAVLVGARQPELARELVGWLSGGRGDAALLDAGYRLP